MVLCDALESRLKEQVGGAGKILEDGEQTRIATVPEYLKTQLVDMIRSVNVPHLPLLRPGHLLVL